MISKTNQQQMMNNFENNLLDLIRQETAKLSAENETLIKINSELQQRLELVSHVAQHGTDIAQKPQVVRENYTPTVILDERHKIYLLQKEIKSWINDQQKFNEIVECLTEDDLRGANGILNHVFKPASVNGNLMKYKKARLWIHAYRYAYFPNSKSLKGSRDSITLLLKERRFDLKEIREYIPGFVP